MASLQRSKSASIVAGSQSISTMRHSSAVSATGIGGCLPKADCSASPERPTPFFGAARTKRQSEGNSTRVTSVPIWFASNRPPSTRNPPCWNPYSPMADLRPRCTRIARVFKLISDSSATRDMAVATANPSCVPEPNPACAGMVSLICNSQAGWSPSPCDWRTVCIRRSTRDTSGPSPQTRSTAAVRAVNTVRGAAIMTPTPPNRPPAGAPTESGPKCNREPVVTETSLIVFSTNSPNS